MTERPRRNTYISFANEARGGFYALEERLKMGGMDSIGETPRGLHGTTWAARRAEVEALWRGLEVLRQRVERADLGSES